MVLVSMAIRIIFLMIWLKPNRVAEMEFIFEVLRM